MNRQKKIFLAAGALFVLAVVGFSVHIFSVTTLPGRKGQLRDRIEKRIKADTLPTGTAQPAPPPR